MKTTTPPISKMRTIALTGIPNVGKTTLFNELTDLNQKTGNYPGVTVDKKAGTAKLGEGYKVKVVDLPGTYSLYPRSEDERVVFEVLCGNLEKDKPEAIVAVADLMNLERSLFFISQLMELGIPMLLVLNRQDAAEKEGIQLNTFKLYQKLGIPVLSIAARQKDGISAVKEAIRQDSFEVAPAFLPVHEVAPKALIEDIKTELNSSNDYQALHLLKCAGNQQLLTSEQTERLLLIANNHRFDVQAAQKEETRLRYQKIQEIVAECVSRKKKQSSAFSRSIDRVLLHPVAGYLIFLGILLAVFQAVFSLASYPMDLIDLIFAKTGNLLQDTLPAGPLTSLLAEGIVPGIGGVVIFIPQIALLFGFLTMLEDSGYMSRAVFLTDKLMRPFGLNGKSVVPLISGAACAIPAIMAARNIGNTKDRLITLLVTPLMSCSARLPVYVILIGLVVPDRYIGPFNYQGLAMLGMYLLGTAAALLSALAMKYLIKATEKSYLIIELPAYEWPGLKNVLLTMYTKSRTFVLQAGKVILAISIVLWVLASYGPGDQIRQAEASVAKPKVENPENMKVYNDLLASKKLEASYAGHLGKAIEPVIKPLGYDWKIGIALITSFAAREVFVSTLATLYSLGEDTEDERTIQDRLRQEINPETNQLVYTPATGWSLLVFYAFAMQCMSTLAVVYRETKGWKWPIIQTTYMTALAYGSAWLVYHFLA